MGEYHVVALLTDENEEYCNALVSAVESLNGLCACPVAPKRYPIGYRALQGRGDALPAATLEGVRRSRAAVLGPVSVGKCPPPSPVGRLRKELGLNIDVRSTLPLGKERSLTIFRECSEGFLADRNLVTGYGEFVPSEGLALSLRVISEEKSRAVAHAAFAYAVRHGRTKVTVAHKANALPLTCGLFRDTCLKAAKEYPAIQVDDEWVDSVAYNLVTRGADYDIILTTNLFGDILSDEACALAAGMMTSVNYGPDAVVISPMHNGPLTGRYGQVQSLLVVRTLMEWLGETQAVNEATLRLQRIC